MSNSRVIGSNRGVSVFAKCRESCSAMRTEWNGFPCAPELLISRFSVRFRVGPCSSQLSLAYDLHAAVPSDEQSRAAPFAASYSIVQRGARPPSSKRWAQEAREMVARGQHHTVERRLLAPRRSDLARRIAERRLELIPLDEERRERAERRQLTEGRRPIGRRQGETAHPDRFVVLVVSDEDDEARRVRAFLDGAAPDRFGVAAAAPQSSLARLARGGVDVVLLALPLSARRGFATFTELRALAPTVPFLFLSDSDDEGHGLEAVRAGAQDFL